MTTAVQPDARSFVKAAVIPPPAVETLLETGKNQAAVVGSEIVAFVTTMAFGLESKSKVTQVLFFKVKKNEATLKRHQGKVTINTRVLDQVKDDLQAKLAAHAESYVKALPDLGPSR